jgi:hypothetical protein
MLAVIDSLSANFLAGWTSEALPDLAVMTLGLFGTMLGAGLLVRLAKYLVAKL